MSHWAFVIAAYAITAIGTISLVWASWAAMRHAERQIDALREER